MIHTVGPVYEDAETSAPVLEAAYSNSMKLAEAKVRLICAVKLAFLVIFSFLGRVWRTKSFIQGLKSHWRHALSALFGAFRD